MIDFFAASIAALFAGLLLFQLLTEGHDQI